MKKTVTILLILVLVAGAALVLMQSDANNDVQMMEESMMKEEMMMKMGHSHPMSEMNVDESLEVEKGYIILQVNGFVCEVCAKKTRHALEMLPFVDDVDVDIKNQMVSVKLEDGMMPDLDVIAQAIREKGFDPFMAYMMDDSGKTVRIEL